MAEARWRLAYRSVSRTACTSAVAMTVSFTANTHFGDHRTINIHRRPFASATQMDRALIEGWNETVGPDDEVWHLGDFCRKPADGAELLAALNGGIHLVCGNNDATTVREQPGWHSVQDYAEILAADRLLVMCHYPFRNWKRQHKGAINLHGHSHGAMKPLPRQLDVGADVWDFRPALLDMVLAKAIRSRS